MFVFILEHIYPLVATRETSDIRAPMYSLLYHTLLNNWQYFFKSTIAGTGIHYSDSLTHLLKVSHSLTPPLLTYFSHAFTHLLNTHSLPHSFTHLLTHLLTYLLSYLLTYSLTYLSTLTHSLNHTITHSFTHSVSNRTGHMKDKKEKSK